jgi:hypothetical protein
VIVRVRDLGPDVKRKLSQAGVRVIAEMPTAKAMIGTVAVGKIAALADLEEVTFISPHTW